MNQRLRADPRTTWATHVYGQIGHFPLIPDRVGDHVLNWLGTEHAEIMTRGLSGHRRPVRAFEARVTALVVRTPSRCLFLLDDLTGHEWVPGMSQGFSLRDQDIWVGGNGLRVSNQGYFSSALPFSTDTFVAYRLAPRNVAQLFTPTAQIAECLLRGAGRHIMRLPERSDVPPAPRLDELSYEHGEQSFHGQILTGWNSVEELAARHLRFLGVHDAQQTKAGADGGLDVASPSVAAQAKQVAKPIGRPMLQGLVGAADPTQYTVFYSTSGFTDEALDFAAARGIALYAVSGMGDITALTDWTRHFERLVGSDAVGWREALKYQSETRQRCAAAHRQLNHGHEVTVGDNPYLVTALKMLLDPPPFNSPREMVIHHHHAELLLANWATYTYGHYPVNAVLCDVVPESQAQATRPPDLTDFY